MENKDQKNKAERKNKEKRKKEKRINGKKKRNMKQLARHRGFTERTSQSLEMLNGFMPTCKDLLLGYDGHLQSPAPGALTGPSLTTVYAPS